MTLSRRKQHYEVVALEYHHGSRAPKQSHSCRTTTERDIRSSLLQNVPKEGDQNCHIARLPLQAQAMEFARNVVTDSDAFFRGAFELQIVRKLLRQVSGTHGSTVISEFPPSTFMNRDTHNPCLYLSLKESRRKDWEILGQVEGRDPCNAGPFLVWMRNESVM